MEDRMPAIIASFQIKTKFDIEILITNENIKIIL